jgi:hypothetical protein
MRWAEHVTRIGYGRNAHRNLVSNPEGKNSLEKINVDGRIILKYVSNKQDGEPWFGLMWLRIRKNDGTLKTRN